jgi:dsRNA-specific ribonuclease
MIGVTIQRRWSSAVEGRVTMRRTKVGILDLPQLGKLTEYYVKMIKGETVSDVPAPTSLRPAQYAFLHRLGLSDPLGIKKESTETMEADWMACFYPPGYSINSDNVLNQSGSRAVHYFTREYIAAKWPNLPANSPTQRLLLTGFAGDSGLSALARHHGIRETMQNLIGLKEPLPTDLESLNERIRFLTFPRIARRAPREAESDMGVLKRAAQLSKPQPDKSQVTAQRERDEAWVIKSVFGVIRKHFGSRTLRAFLDARLFSAQFDMSTVYQCPHPLIELTEWLQKKASNIHPEFRLVKESGRLSDSAMFIVSVHSPVDGVKLGEAHGPSIMVAQERACLDALRSIHLLPSTVLSRPSDSLSSDQLDQAIDTEKQ